MAQLHFMYILMGMPNIYSQPSGCLTITIAVCCRSLVHERTTPLPHYDPSPDCPLRQAASPRL